MGLQELFSFTHKKNEAFLDIVESINMLMTQKGQVLRSEIIGDVKVNSKLSGMPDLKLGINDKGIFSKYLDDDTNIPSASATTSDNNTETDKKPSITSSSDTLMKFQIFQFNINFLLVCGR